MSSKKFVISFFICMSLVLAIFISFIAIIDPYFQYHKPLPQLEYNITTEPYTNVGMLKQFEYDSIITGTSMTQNFDIYSANELFDENFIKVPLLGGTYFDVSKQLEVALNNREIETVIRGLDYSRFFENHDAIFHTNYPYFLYDNNIFNDFEYLLNFDIFLLSINDVILYTVNGNETIDINDYSRWDHLFTFSKEATLASYTRNAISDTTLDFTQEIQDELKMNIEENIIKQALENPNTEFYLFYTPYSMAFWDGVSRSGSMENYLDAKLYVTEMLLEIDNIKLFSFETNTDIIANLDNYKDEAHYSFEINELILEYMSNDEYLITKENYHQILQAEREFILNYDYDSIYE